MSGTVRTLVGVIGFLLCAAPYVVSNPPPPNNKCRQAPYAKFQPPDTSSYGCHIVTPPGQKDGPNSTCTPDTKFGVIILCQGEYSESAFGPVCRCEDNKTCNGTNGNVKINVITKQFAYSCTAPFQDPPGGNTWKCACREKDTGVRTTVTFDDVVGEACGPNAKDPNAQGACVQP